MSYQIWNSKKGSKLKYKLKNSPFPGSVSGKIYDHFFRGVEITSHIQNFADDGKGNLLFASVFENYPSKVLDGKIDYDKGVITLTWNVEFNIENNRIVLDYNYKMNENKKKSLENAGWKFGTAEEFLEII